MGDRKGIYSVLMGQLGEKRTLVRLRRRCENNIKMGL
jgi:hypothetical protein